MPMERLISPIERDWHADGDTAAALSRWEQETGLRLPDDYRRFLIRYNGGRPYPNLFRHSARDADGAQNPTEHFVDPLYGWDRVVPWSSELANRLPPGSLAIGADPGLLEIVLSLRPEDHGAIYSWLRNRAAWGSAENSYLCPQASSFSAFVASLSDDDEKNGHACWHTPLGERLRRKLDV
jgi:hypothetical protein